MFLLFFLKLALKHHQCNFQEEEDRILRRLPPRKLKREQHSAIDITKRKPIRLVFNTDSIFNASLDSQQCTGVGVPSSMCTSDDILTDGKRYTLSKTIENVKNYLGSLLLVDQEEYPIALTVIDYELKGLPYEVEDCDLYIPFVVRPFEKGSTIVASASTRATGKLNRATIGFVTVNPKNLNEYDPEGYDSGERQLFGTILHELNHVLCFSGSHFNNWIDIETGERWKQPMLSFTNKYGITQKFLVTRELKKWVNERFNVWSDDYMKYGLELEDGGGEGTAGSHPNERLYFTDVMQGRTYGPAYISPIFFHSLIDSGWYTLNETTRKATEQQISYLNAQLYSNVEQLQENALTEPGWISFPQMFIAKESLEEQCFTDYIYKGIARRINKDKLSKLSFVNNETIKWYNPYNEEMVGEDDLIDFVPIVYPTEGNCRSSKSISILRQEDPGYNPLDYGEKYGVDSICAQSSLRRDTFGMFLLHETASCYEAWCGTDDRVRLVINGKTILCKFDYEKRVVDGFNGYVKCPPHKVVCANKKKVKLINMIDIMPEIGTVDGNNLIGIKGTEFDLYDDLEISIGPLKCNIITKTNESLLCRLQKADEHVIKKYKGENVDISAQSKQRNITTVLEGMYTFAEYTFNAGTPRSTISLILICLFIVYSLIFML